MNTSTSYAQVLHGALAGGAPLCICRLPRLVVRTNFPLGVSCMHRNAYYVTEKMVFPCLLALLVAKLNPPVLVAF